MAAQVAGRSFLKHAIYAGEMLVEAKGRTVRGGWALWLEVNFDGSQRVARAYMRMARNRAMLEAHPQHAAFVKLRDALLYIAEGTLMNEEPVSRS